MEHINNFGMIEENPNVIKIKEMVISMNKCLKNANFFLFQKKEQHSHKYISGNESNNKPTRHYFDKNL